MRKNKQEVWIYFDSDNNDYHVFDTFEKAKQYGEDSWGTNDPEMWEDCGDDSFNFCEYVTIKKVNVE